MTPRQAKAVPGWFCATCASKDGLLVTAPLGVVQPACPRCGSEMRKGL